MPDVLTLTGAVNCVLFGCLNWVCVRFEILLSHMSQCYLITLRSIWGDVDDMSLRCLIKVLSIYFTNNYTFWWYQVHLLFSCRLVEHGLFCLLTNLSNKTPYQRSSSTKKMGNQFSENCKTKPLAGLSKDRGKFKVLDLLQSTPSEISPPTISTISYTIP